MQLPGIVASELGAGEDVAAAVELGGDDRLFVTAERTLVYRAGGVLSDESVSAFPHDADRLTVSEGRRKTTLAFEYAVGDDRDLALPSDRLADALQPILAAVLRTRDATDPGERVHRVFSFSELTLVVTDERLLKHVGTVLWDDDHEAIPFEAVTDLDYEEGSVATGVVLTVDGRKERLKAPNDRLPEVRDHLERAILAAHGVDTIDDLAGADGDTTEADADDTTATAVADIGGVDALDAGESVTRADAADAATSHDATDATERRANGGPPTDTDPALPHEDADSPGTDDRDTSAAPTPDAGATAADDAGAPEDASETADAGPDETSETGDTDGTDGGATPFTESFEPAGGDRVHEELSALRTAVERQNELLQRHSRAIERLVETLRED